MQAPDIEEQPDEEIARALRFNQDPTWHEFIQTLEPAIKKMGIKFCAADEHLRQDAAQEARMGLAAVHPEEVRGYDAFMAGEISEEQWSKTLDKYCRQVIRYSMLSYLDSHAKGNWYVGRTRKVKDRVTGETRTVHLRPRYASLDELVDDHGAQIDSNGRLVWAEVTDDGLLPIDQFEEEVRGHS